MNRQKVAGCTPRRLIRYGRLLARHPGRPPQIAQHLSAASQPFGGKFSMAFAACVRRKRLLLLERIKCLEIAVTLLQEIQDRTSDRKSTRLNSSHVAISYAVFCLKKK